MSEKEESMEELKNKLDEDLDKHIDEILERNKDYKYKDGLDPEKDLDEQLRLIPAFSNQELTQEDIENSSALQALQALKYESEDPHTCAVSHKEDGNYHFQKKDYKKAIAAYTEGLKQKYEDITLTAVLYTNRATSNFYLGNNRSALNDAIWALKHKPDHMKAIIRAAISCFDLENYDNCLKWCERGMKIDAKEKKLSELKKKAIHQKKQKERDDRKKQLRELKNLTERNTLLETIEARQIQVEYCGEVTRSRQGIEELLNQTNAPHSGKLRLDESKQLCWPVYFLYPEFNQSDFIESFEENVSFIDQFLVMFETPPPWDVKKSYLVEHIKIYFEDKKNNELVRVKPEMILKEVLSNKKFVVRGNCPAFIVLSARTSYFKKTFERQRAVEIGN